ncbi:MAG: hypothetical protein AAGE93_24010 [Bacteroidota bacterium]
MAAELRKLSPDVVVSWKAMEKEGKVKIWLSSTNHFKDYGKSDEYRLAGETFLSNEQLTVDLTEPQSTFHKVIIEGPHNTVNQWIVGEEE